MRGRAKSAAARAHRATRSGTHRFALRFPQADRTYFRQARGLTVGSIGIGTYRGGLDAVSDRRLHAAIVSAVASGCNLIDTARSYRGGRSESVVGSALRAVTAAGIAKRDEIIVCSKAGYVPGSSRRLARSAVSACEGNALGPVYLSREISLSLQQTGLDVIDIYLLHDAEVHLPRLGLRKFYRALTDCFDVLERHVSDGRIGTYGLACWSGFDAPAGTPPLDLIKVMRAAELAAGNRPSHFGVIETPLNWVHRNPVAASGQGALWEACRENELVLLGSSPLLGGRLARLPPELGRAIPGKLSDPQRSIQFARSLPGTCATLVGMSRTDHIAENLRLRLVPALRGSLVQRLCLALDRL